MSEDERQLIEELASMRVESVVASMLSTLHSQALLRLGVLRDAEQHADLAQAALAIDTLGALVPTAQRFMPPEAVSELKGALAQLRLAYASAAGSAGAPTLAPDEQPAGAPTPRNRPAPPPPPRPKIWTPRGDV